MKPKPKSKWNNEKNKQILFLLLGSLGIILFILQIFVFESHNGLIGYLVCLFSMLLTIISFIKLFKISKKFRATLETLLELL